jgi:drug/metabolite transporter (DMT)-like permease
MTRLKQILQNGILCMLLSSFFFGMMGALVKFSLQEIHLMEVVFFRSIVSALILGVILYFQRGSFLGNRPLLLLGRGLAGFGAIITNFYAVSKIPLGEAAILNQTSPIFVVFLSAFLLDEKISRRVFFLSLLSFIGVGFIVKPSFSTFDLAALSGLLSGFLASLAYVAIRELHATDSFLTMAFYFTGITSLLSAPYTLTHFAVPRLPVFLSLLGVGLTGTFGQLLMTYSYKNEEASIVSPFSYVAVIFSFILGMLFFGEMPDWYSVLGSAIVISCCLVLSQIRNVRYLKIKETVMVQTEEGLKS